MDSAKGKVTSWQNRMTNISSSIGYLFNNALFSDVHFQFDEEGKIQTLYAHKFILSIRSEVFDAMFNGALSKAENPEVVKIEDITSENFFAFLNLLYTEKCLPRDGKVETVCGVLYASVKYNIPGLIDMCRNFIHANIRLDEIFAIKRMCTLLDPEVVGRCWELIDKEAIKIIHGEEFLSIDNAELCEFLQRDGLVASELDLFNAAVKWAEEQCKMVNIPGTPTNARTVLGQAIYSIRFPTMTLSEFSIQVVGMKLLSKDEAHDVLHYLALKAENVSFLELPKTAFSCVPRGKTDPDPEIIVGSGFFQAACRCPVSMSMQEILFGSVCSMCSQPFVRSTDLIL